MKIRNKFQESARLKFSQASQKIKQITFSDCFTIKFLPLKFLTKVMLHWHLESTVIWKCWFPIYCEFILSLHHTCLDNYERASHLRFWKLPQSPFVGLFHCDILYPFLNCQFQPLFEIILNIRLILLYPSGKNIIIQLVLLHCTNITVRIRNIRPILIFDFSSYLPYHGHRILSIIVNLFLVWNGIG